MTPATMQTSRRSRADLEVLVRFEGVTKRYGAVTVLNDISFDVRRGEIHALVGENGAGKSTISRCLSGLAVPSDGQIVIAGEPVTEFSVEDADRRGVVLIHQELALAEHLSVAENMFLGHEVHRFGVLASREMALRADQMLKRLGCSAQPHDRVSSLPVSERQMVEIAKALLRDARLIIMDEPTAVLTPRESERLFAQVERLRAEGVAIIYVSHKLDEVKRLSDRISVLRDGQYQGTWQARDLSVGEIANLMVGRELSEVYPPRRRVGATDGALCVRDFLAEQSTSPVNFAALHGEILGVAGLIGSGRTELFESIVGLRAQRGGEILLNGKPFKACDYRQALAAGVVYVTEDRKGRGLLLGASIAANVSVLDQVLGRSALVNSARERRALDWARQQFRIEAPYANIRVGRLSGGNQQKVLLAKSLLNEPEIIIVDEPTRGIDVGTRTEIYRLLRRMADDGRAIIVISSDLQEVIGLSDRVLVMHDNAVAGVLQGEEITQEAIVHLATGIANNTGGRT